MPINHHHETAELDAQGVPRPDGTALGNLRHVVALYADSPADREVLLGTSNVYGPGERTGMTHGDLRRLAEIVQVFQELLDEHKNPAPDYGYRETLRRRGHRLLQGQEG